MASKPSRFAWLVPATITGSLVPFWTMLFALYRGRLGPNPIATAMNQLGLLALLFLLLSLSCTPLKLLFRWTWPMHIRRTLGLFAFFTVLCHFLVYLGLDQGLAFSAVLQDLEKRPFILVGFLGLVLLAPLALTSTKAAVTRLGYARWSRLHKLAYAAAVLGVVHFFLRVKRDLTLPLLFAAGLALLFSVRLVAAYQKKRQQDIRLSAK